MMEVCDEQLTDRAVSILGSTGSIGTQSLAVCRAQGFRVELLTAGSNARLLEKQAREFRPRAVAIRDESRYSALKTALGDLPIQVLAGSDGICEAVATYGSGTVINAIVGIAGLRPSLAAIDARLTVALANKETLITGGALVMERARERGVRLIPVDSEHSAIFQCLQAGAREDVRGVVLTASGGPFFGKSREELRHVDVGQALAHPNWSMGPKITIDSATLMNKGLEFLEAMWLFDLKPDEIQVVVHRQSVVHSAVEFADGSVIAQMGAPDMRMAIQYALTWPRRMETGGQRLDLCRYGSLTFEEPDLETFRCLRTCMEAARRGGLAACVANGANEQAVDLFLKEKIGFLEIGDLVAEAVDTVKTPAGTGLAEIEAADRAAREFVLKRVT